LTCFYVDKFFNPLYIQTIIVKADDSNCPKPKHQLAYYLKCIRSTQTTDYGAITYFLGVCGQHGFFQLSLSRSRG